jgi:hypothetical protein
MSLASVSISEIRDIPLFHTVKKQHAAAVANIALHIHYDPHTTILRAGSALKRIGIVQDGSLTRAFNVDTHILPIEHLHRNGLWGQRALIQPNARITETLRTEKHAAECIEIPIFQLLQLFEKFPELGATVAHALLKLQLAQKTHDDTILSCLYGINHILQSEGTPNDVCRASLQLTADTLGARFAFLAHFDTTTHRIQMIEHLQTPTLAGASYSLLADTLLATVYTTRTSLIIGTHTRERKFLPLPYFRPTMTIVPLIAHNEVIGALAITDSLRQGGFTTQDSELLNVIGGMLVPLLTSMKEQEITAQKAHLKRSYIGSWNA